MSIETGICDSEELYTQAVGIRKKVFVEEQGVPQELEVDQYEKTCIHFFAKWNGQMAATGRLRRKGALIKFERIATLPEYRGKRLGEALMLSMQQYCLRQEPELLPYMHAQLSAKGFYDRLGWSVVGKNFFEAGIEHVAMMLPSPNDLDPKIVAALRAMDDLPPPLAILL